MSAVHPLYIDGVFLAGDGREVLPVLNPATGADCAALTCATAEDAAAAAAAARRAHQAWSQRAPRDRAAALQMMAVKLLEHREPIARALTREQGKPLPEAREELDGCAAIFRFYADTAETYEFNYVVPGGADRHIRETAKGPVLIINTWNFPVEAVVSHMAPSLAAGCASVVLANRDAPGCVAAFFQAMDELDLPPGLINLVTGRSSQLSDQLVDDPAIAHVSYTGSVSVGRALAARAGGQLKRCTLELGGNAPAIVLPGADIETAAKAYAGKRFWNAGQVCTAPNRIYVNRAQYDGFTRAVVDYAESLTVGDGIADGVDVGPMANERRSTWMAEIVADALQRGATMLTGQTRPSETGFFWKPTVLADVPEDALGMREEIFGPIACIRPYDDLDEVIARVNTCNIGLSGYVQGPDTSGALAVAQRLEVGSVGANQMVTAFIDTPFGGIKSSGLGTVGGASAMREYLFPRLVAVPPAEPQAV
ncbi:hypothetical protein RA19_14870 [Leisingera sp. ANG-M1]|uniref:aldehyde dehydrogenase family protein n=1 Tax=Leisingera sp. ANG-M1 TaxID=1577895 RepID=UPI0005805062|nr:aldehyde dehydrogenase family protein [Leisingera sp. ANG-M1]KIC09601.1 hypothetical protein RA19_14870 [Leisingera sp. ANG-M1]